MVVDEAHKEAGEHSQTISMVINMGQRTIRWAPNRRKRGSPAAMAKIQWIVGPFKFTIKGYDSICSGNSIALLGRNYEDGLSLHFSAAGFRISRLIQAK